MAEIAAETRSPLMHASARSLATRMAFHENLVATQAEIDRALPEISEIPAPPDDPNFKARVLSSLRAERGQVEGALENLEPVYDPSLTRAVREVLEGPWSEDDVMAEVFWQLKEIGV